MSTIFRGKTQFFPSGVRIKPRFQPLRIERDIELEPLQRIILEQLPLLTLRFRSYEIPDAAGQICMALRAGIGTAQSELGVRIDQAMQVVGEPRDVANLAEMRRVNRLRPEGNHALYRAVKRGRIEL